LEREIKLRFDSADAARRAIVTLGAAPYRARRLQDDCLLDDDSASLQQRGCALRLRTDGTNSIVTFKGPIVPGPMKLREELESGVERGEMLLRLLGELGYTPRWRYQKYREEFLLDGVIVALDETPVGTFIELEGEEAAIAAAARGLGRGPADYILASYRALFLEYREAHRLTTSDMVFQSL
jgi:adenylate cyclase class 2